MVKLFLGYVRRLICLLETGSCLNLKIPTPAWLVKYLEPARYKGAWGGRSSGKSHAFAEMVIESHILDPNRRTVCVREVQKSLAQSVKALLEGKIEALGLGDYFEVQQSCIKSTKGTGIIIFQGMQNHTADSIKSLEGFDCAWIEESQSISQRSLDLLRPTIRKPNSEIWATWNPRFETDPIDVLLRGKVPPPNSIVSKVGFEDNPWMPDVMVDEMEYDKRRDSDKYAHIWLGEYQQNSEARVFKNWRIEEFDAPADAIHSFGADWGSSHPTALIRSHIIGRTIYIDYEAYQIGCTIDNTPHLFAEVPESDRWPIIADSNNPQMIQHLKDHGYPKIFGAKKGKNSIVEGVEFLKSYDIVVHPRCRHTIDELTLYSYKVDPVTGKVLPIIEDDNNHVIDSLRYSHEGLRRALGTRKKKAAVNAIPVTSHWS